MRSRRVVNGGSELNTRWPQCLLSERCPPTDFCFSLDSPNLREGRHNMGTEELLEQCLQALTSGQDLPADLARYLMHHPEQRAEVEELLAIAQRASRIPPVELSQQARKSMQARLAARLGFDP